MPDLKFATAIPCKLRSIACVYRISRFYWQVVNQSVSVVDVTLIWREAVAAIHIRNCHEIIMASFKYAG